MGIIYKTINLINNKIYIGQDSKNRNYYLGSGKLIKRAIKKYGIENFKKEVIEECSKENANERETYWIKELKAYDRNIVIIFLKQHLVVMLLVTILTEKIL